ADLGEVGLRRPRSGELKRHARSLRSRRSNVNTLVLFAIWMFCCRYSLRVKLVMTNPSLTFGPADLAPRARIREAALRLYAEHGTQGTSIRMVAEQAGMSAGAGRRPRPAPGVRPAHRRQSGDRRVHQAGHP